MISRFMSNIVHGFMNTCAIPASVHLTFVWRDASAVTPTIVVVTVEELCDSNIVMAWRVNSNPSIPGGEGGEESKDALPTTMNQSVQCVSQRVSNAARFDIQWTRPGPSHLVASECLSAPCRTRALPAVSREQTLPTKPSL